MPVFIQNENELRNEDDSPLAANTPSTGSVYDNSHVVECGNQVLELIQKHKKEVQARMANHEHGFRAMLERSRRIEANHGYREPEKQRPGGSKRLLSENSGIIQRYSTAIEKDIKQSHGVRTSIGAIVDVDMTGPGNPIFASSDEYLELPKTGWPEVPTRTNTQATNSPTNNNSPNVEEVNWYEPDQEYDVEEGLCKPDDDDDDDDDNGNNNQSVREFATRIRFGFPDGNLSIAGRGLGNDESNEPSAEPSSPSIHPSSNNVPSKSSPSIHPSATNVPSKSSKPSSHSPSKTTSKHTKKSAKSAKTAKSQSSHNKNHVPGSDDGNSSSDQDVSVASSYYSSTASSSVWQDLWGFIGDHFWAILIALGVLVLIIAFLLGFGHSSGSDSGSGSSSTAGAGAGAESNKGKVIWHHGPVM